MSTNTRTGGKVWNVSHLVVDLVLADSREGAVAALARRITQVGLEPYDDEAIADAFESDDQSDEARGWAVEPFRYTRNEIIHGTGFPRGARFIMVPAVPGQA